MFLNLIFKIKLNFFIQSVIDMHKNFVLHFQTFSSNLNYFINIFEKKQKVLLVHHQHNSK
jgi:hypothetical protein